MKYLSRTPRSFSTFNCIVCAKILRGRRDKKYCSLDCKNHYHARRRFEMRIVVDPVDRLLHRNFEIITEFHEEAKSKKFVVHKYRLQRKGFKFNYYTTSHRNAKGKFYYSVYNYAWMEFSDGNILIVKRS